MLEPKSWTPLYSGEYVLKVGGNINKTLCNIEPGATPITEIAIHARSALHKGTPCNGSLDGGGQLGETAGTGYTHYHGSDPPTFQDTWGDTDYIVKTIKDIATQWNGLHAMPRINVGDISKSGGGAMSGHSCHQNGLEADIRYVRNDGTEGPLDLSTDSTLYSKTLTVELMQLFVATGLVDLIYVHPDSDIAASDVAGVVQDSSATHINHFHVRLMDPDGADSNNC